MRSHPECATVEGVYPMTTETYNVVGKPTRRPDGPEKVTGAGVYSPDLKLDGMLWGRSLRSPYPHARIVRIDTSRAKDAPGVHAVLTGDDVRGIRYGRRLFDVPVLANDRVRFIGERIVAVAADSKDEADAALALVDVEYEEIPAVFDVDTGLGPGAPILHPEFNEYTGVAKTLDSPTNGFSHDSWTVGDIDAGFANSDVIVEATYETPKGHQGYLEPHSCVVAIDGDGRAQIWASNKAPFLMRQQLSTATGEDTDAFRVNHAYIGGDFGGKGSPMEIPLAYYLSKASKRPVKIVMDYSEELQAANPRHGGRMRIKAGAKHDGTLVAWKAEVRWNSGAYGGFKPLPTANLGGAQFLGGVAYRIPNTQIDSIQVYTNSIPCGHYRAPGAPQSVFAGESHMDAVARAIGMDPLDFRLKNIIGEGDANAVGHVHEDVHAREALEAAARDAGYGGPKAPNVGRGIAMADHGAPGGETHAVITIHDTGDIAVETPLFEQGAGQYVVLQQVVSEGLGVPTSRVKIEPRDTDNVQFDSGIGGSHTTRIATIAAHEGALDAANNLKQLAAELLGWAEERIALRDEQLVNEGSGESIQIGDLVGRAGAPVVGRGHVRDQTRSPMTSFAAQIAEVEVDPDTGEINLTRLTTAHDVGTIINPIGHQGQVEGGVVQAIGFGLMEELVVDEGRVSNPSFAEFKIPTANDVPVLSTVLLESDSGSGPYKIKSAGESSNVPTAAAIANAVEDAVGVRIADLPVTAEKVYNALKAKNRR